MYFKTTNYKKYSNKQTRNDQLNPYMSWLEYKKQQHIVRYYPTLKMYETYVYWCYANGFTAFGCEQEREKAFAYLLQELSDRLSK